MTEIRRSSRSRKAATSIYDEAKEELERHTPSPRGRKRKTNDNDDDDDDDADSGGEEDELMSTSSSTSSDDESEAAAPSRKTNNSSNSSKKKKKKSPKKIHVQFKQKASTSNNKKKKEGGVIPSKSRALETLKRKAVDPKEESSEDSLTAAILEACIAPKKKKKNHYEDEDDNDNKNNNANSASTIYPDAFVSTAYTAVLEPIAKRVLQLYQQDANQAHVMLLNLVFRSVGGSHGTCLSHSTNLEEMEDDQWEQVVTSIVDDMRHTPHDSILLCACPKGALFANDSNKHSVAQEEYRRIYEHFWYLLGTLGLNHNNTNSSSTASSFEIERIRDLALRMMELVTVGQPDLRAAAAVAALQLALAACDGTLDLHTRLSTAQRQWKAAKAAKTSTKQRTLEQTVQALQRTLDDLEQVVLQTIVPGVFMQRYRDSDPYIRAACLRALSSLTVQRPDLFLLDTYLKYFGWMMSDKHAVVRVAALQGLLVPFHRFQEQQQKHKSASGSHPLTKINLAVMDNVMGKFLPRIANCVIDVAVEVQEQAMALLLVLLREGFMDEVDDDQVWNQINLRALAPDTTARVRRDALYFVLEQLEPFDAAAVEAKSKVSPERQQVDQIDSIAVWIAHSLSDGQIPMECLRVNLTDYVVQSLRDMPEHAHLITNWTALLAAIQQDTKANQSQSQQQRANMAKQRVLLQMLAAAAALEVGSLHAHHHHHVEDDKDDDNETSALDVDLVKVKHQLQPPSPVDTSASGGKKSKKNKSSDLARESLTVGLVRALPQLLSAFKGDLVILRSLTSLPQYFVHSVLSLPQRKNDVQALIKILSSLFLDSTDVTVLQNTCLAMALLAQGDHSRNREALLEFKNMATTVRDRFLHLCQPVNDGKFNAAGSANKRRRSSRSPQKKKKDSQESDEVLDQEHAISLCLLRLRVISKRWYLGDLLQKDKSSNDDDDATEDEEEVCVNLCATIAKALAKDLKAREIVLPQDEESSIQIPKIWSESDPRVHSVVGKSVVEGLSTIMSVTAWKMQRAVEKEFSARDQQDSDSDEESKDSDDADGELDAATTAELEIEAKCIVRMRNGLIKLLGLCFDQYLEEPEEEDFYQAEHVAFSTLVQTHASRVASDVRSLFPREWSETSSPLLQACALNEDQHLIGGSVRFFRSKEMDFTDDNDGKVFVQSLLLPLSRGLCANWVNYGNRREAGAGLAHISHHGDGASKAVGSFSRALKKIDAVRLLEAIMACLRMLFADWVDSEPEEPESDRPSEEEMEAYEAAEREHAESFKIVEQKAARLASSLGVGRVDEKLQPALFGFVREGVRFAFSNEGPGSDDELLFGSRLSFLLLLTKYLSLVKRNKTQLKQLKEDFLSKEKELRELPGWGEIREEDFDSLNQFRKALGLKEEKMSVAALTPSDDDENSLQRGSRGGKTRQLSPLMESDLEDENDDDEPGPGKKRSQQAKISPLMESDAEDEDEEPESGKRKTPIKEASDEEDSEAFSDD